MSATAGTVTELAAGSGDSEVTPKPSKMPRLAWIAPVLAAGLATLASLMLIRTGQWSVFDEYTHFDYVVRVAEDLDLPPINDTLGQTALQAAACERAQASRRSTPVAARRSSQPRLPMPV